MTQILLIEDDSDFASVLMECLESEHDATVVDVLTNQQSARQYFLGGNLESINCILLDLRLPETPGDTVATSRIGLGLLQELRQTHKFCGTIIVLTNSSDAVDGQRALAAGCDAYLCKSIASCDMDALISELHVAITGRVMMVAAPMRHIFWREDVSPKEAQLMDLLVDGKQWHEIARLLDYNSPKAAANTADRIFDKLIPIHERQRMEACGQHKKDAAMQIWTRRFQHKPARPQSPALPR